MRWRLLGCPKRTEVEVKGRNERMLVKIKMAMKEVKDMRRIEGRIQKI